MTDDTRVPGRGADALPAYRAGEADDAVTVSISTMPGEWLVNTNDAVVVPMSMADLVDGLRLGKLTERSLVWRAGMQEWAPVASVPQLKLAARLPREAPVTEPPRSRLSNKPPPKPVRPTPVPSSASAAAVVLPSRKATLPFGFPTLQTGASRPQHEKPSAPRHATPPPPSAEPGVLAVYNRPAATISFDLSAERAPAGAAIPNSLAPTYTDSPKRAAFISEPSVVAARDFRRAQRSSKRLIWLSSLASAAAASVITFLLARGSAPAPQRPLAPVAAAAAAPLLPPPTPQPEAASAVVAPEPEPSTTPTKPKKSKARASTARRHAAPPAAPETPSSNAQPNAEPNPYDMPAADDAPAKPELGATPVNGTEASTL